MKNDDIDYASLQKEIIDDMLFAEVQQDLSNEYNRLTNSSDNIMQFGKYKGMLLREIPRDYLYWLAKQSNISKELKSKIWNILKNKKSMSY